MFLSKKYVMQLSRLKKPQKGRQRRRVNRGGKLFSYDCEIEEDIEEEA